LQDLKIIRLARKRMLVTGKKKSKVSIPIRGFTKKNALKIPVRGRRALRIPTTHG
jgi:hypothetical protein